MEKTMGVGVFFDGLSNGDELSDPALTNWGDDFWP